MKTLTFKGSIRFEIELVIDYDGSYAGLSHLEGYFLVGRFTATRRIRVKTDPRWHNVKVIELPGRKLEEVRGYWDEMLYLTPVELTKFTFDYPGLVILETHDQPGSVAEDGLAARKALFLTQEEVEATKHVYEVAAVKRKETIADNREWEEEYEHKNALRQQYEPQLHELWLSRAKADSWYKVGQFHWNKPRGQWQHIRQQGTSKVIFVPNNRCPLPNGIENIVLVFEPVFTITNSSGFLVQAVNFVNLGAFEREGDLDQVKNS